MQKIIQVSIDTINQNSTCLYENVRKGDTLLMNFKIYQGSASIDLTGQSIHIVLKKSDGYAVEKIINSVTGNNFSASFDVQATIVIGDVIGIIEISDSNGTDITNTFTFEVKENPSSNIIINSKNEIETLSQVVNLINSYNENAEELEKANDLAVQNKSDLTNLNNSGSQLASRLESDIATGTTVATRLEGDIIIGNNLDNVLKKDFETGSNLDQLLINAISDGNDVITQLKNNANWSYIQQIFALVNKISIGTLDDESNDYLIDENNVQFIG